MQRLAPTGSSWISCPQIVAVPLEGFSNAAVVKLFVTRDTGRTIDGRKFQGAIDSCGDPDSSFTDLHEL